MVASLPYRMVISSSRTVVLASLFLACAHTLEGQQTVPQSDSIAVRLEQLVASGTATRGDLLRLVVEYPLSPRVEDALIRLTEEDIRSGDRAAARRHLELLVHEHLASDRGVKAAQQLAQMMFDDGAAVAGCTVLDSARAHVSTGNVELENQIAYASRRCEQVREAAAGDTAMKVRADSAAVPAKPAPEKAPAGKATPRTPPRPSASGSVSASTAGADRRWSVQVAAYAVRGDALRLDARLRARGFDVRIVGDKPYRVRIGRYASRDSAVAMAARLKAERTTAIVVEAERP